MDPAGQVRGRVVGDPQGPVGVGAGHGAAARRQHGERQALHRLRGRPWGLVCVVGGLERGLGDDVHDAELLGADAGLRPRGGRGVRPEQGRGLDRHTETGGNVTNFENQIEAAFSLYEELGVPGVKTGYAGGTSIGGVEHAHYDQAMVNHYRDVIRIAAEHHLVVEAHEMVKDTGERRTYPNIMTREAVRGMEWEAWSEGNPPEHLVEVPFIRMIAGPVSYTPGIFNITWDPGGPGRPPWRTLEHTRVHSTRAAQMAIYPVFLSGLQMLADVPENYEGQPSSGRHRRRRLHRSDSRKVSVCAGCRRAGARRRVLRACWPRVQTLEYNGARRRRLQRALPVWVWLPCNARPGGWPVAVAGG